MLKARLIIETFLMNFAVNVKCTRFFCLLDGYSAQTGKGTPASLLISANS